MLSIFIIALNEADRIGRTIESVKALSDDIVVVDSGSTDGTQEAAARLGARVIYNPWPGYGPQKRFAEDQCRHDWLLNLDADEVATPELVSEIKQLFASAQPHAAYTISIREILPMETQPSHFGRSVKPIRLYDRRAGRYADSTVHDRVQMERGTIAHLHSALWHYSSRSLAHSLYKLDRYSTMQAADMYKKYGKHLPFRALGLVIIFPIAFFKAYILRLYILKGMPGFVNAVVYAFSRFIRLAKYDELRRK